MHFILKGLPKAAVVTHERVWAASFLQGICGVKSHDVFYINLPLYHSAGFLIGMTGSIERGERLPLAVLTSTLKKKMAFLLTSGKKITPTCGS